MSNPVVSGEDHIHIIISMSQFKGNDVFFKRKIKLSIVR